MYEPNLGLGFQPPENSAQPIWQYMDLAKFISILEKRALFFTNAEKLADPYEGAQPDAAMTNLRRFLDEEVPKDHHPPRYEDVARIFNLMRQDTKGDIGINCWHCNDGESAAMWGLYATRQSGIAVQSTFERLCDSLNRCLEPVLIGMVRYSDYVAEETFLAGTLSPYLHKRKSFECERELRAVVHPLSRIRERAGESEDLLGTYVPVDVGRLIETIHVAPKAQSWVAELVHSVVETRYRLTIPVRHSPLYRGPLY